MPTHIKAKTKRQLHHSASRGKDHALDKAEGEARRSIEWLPLNAPKRPSPKRSFPGLQGHEYRHDGESWQRCEDPEEYGDYIEAEAAKRSWYRAETQRKGHRVMMRRPAAAPVETLTTTFAPWLSDCIAAKIAAGEDPRPALAAIRNAWLTAAQKALYGQRHVLGYAFHADTDDLHIDLNLSRYCGEGGRIGETGLKLVGPWCTAVDRQLRCGAKISAEKQAQIKRSVGNFRHRYGEDQKPLDVRLARALDQAADDILGPELVPYKKAYAEKVPALERAHAAAELAQLDAAKSQLMKRTAPEQLPECGPRPRFPSPPTPEPDFPSVSV